MPKLRFPEFQGTGEWEEKTLGDITYKFSKKNNNVMDYPIYSINNKEGFLPQSEQFDGMDSNSRGYDISLYKIIERNTFAYNPARINVGSIGYSGELNNIIISSLYVCFKTNEEVDDNFLLHFFSTSSFNQSVKNSVEGGIRNYLFYDNFAKITIQLPKKDEQRKIAECLYSLDELITAEDKKLEAYKAHKKGLMQKLFPAEGKTVPEWRFPEFRESGEWVITELGSIFTNRQEKGFLSLPLMSLTDQDGIIPQEDTKRKNNSNADKSKYLRICPGDVAYNTMRMWQGRCAYVNVEGIVSPAYTICKPNRKNKGLFFYYYFKTSHMIKKFHANSQGLVNDTLNLKYDSFSRIPICYPSFLEQQKIAGSLSSLDELISEQANKIEILKIHKKGLMQVFFPSSDEVIV